MESKDIYKMLSYHLIMQEDLKVFLWYGNGDSALLCLHFYTWSCKGQNHKYKAMRPM